MTGSMHWPAAVTVCEVGLRDGLQNEKKHLSVEEKLALLDAVVASGVKSIEIGSFVHPKAVPQMADTGELAKRMTRVPGVEYRVLIPNLKGLERAVDAGITKAKFTVSVSESHCIANFNQTPLEMLAQMAPMAEFAAKHGVTLSGAMSSSWGCAFEGKIPVAQLEKVAAAFTEMGVTELSLSDTTGMANPRQVYEVGTYLHQRFPAVTWVLHLHNTRGMAMACIVAAMQAGITIFDGAFAGLGGCPYVPGAAGNIATEDVVHMLHEMGIPTGIDLGKAMETARLAQSIVEHEGNSAVLRGGRCEDLTTRKAERQNNR